MAKRDTPTAHSPKAGQASTGSRRKSIGKKRVFHSVRDSVDSGQLLEAKQLTSMVRQLLEAQQIPVPGAYAHPKRRDLEAFSRLVVEHGFRKVMQAVKWVYSPLRVDEQVGDWVSGRGWWRTRIVSPRAFRAKWDTIAVQLAVDPLAGVFLDDDVTAMGEAAMTSMEKRQSGNHATPHIPHRHTWACKHTLAALGVSSTVEVTDFDAACRMAERLNREGA